MHEDLVYELHVEDCMSLWQCAIVENRFFWLSLTNDVARVFSDRTCQTTKYKKLNTGLYP